jgi:hypothetical protein
MKNLDCPKKCLLLHLIILSFLIGYKFIEKKFEKENTYYPPAKIVQSNIRPTGVFDAAISETSAGYSDVRITTEYYRGREYDIFTKASQPSVLFVIRVK